jgi:hypothetical protein
MLLRMLEHEGNYSAYTYSDFKRRDFVDSVTQATRLALNKPRFSLCTPTDCAKPVPKIDARLCWTGEGPLNP